MGIFVFTLPDIGEGIHEGEIAKWHIQPGDKVEEDQTLVEVQNDKAMVEIPSPVKGIVKEIKVAEGIVAVVGDELVTIEVEGNGNAGTTQEPAKPEQAPAVEKPKQAEQTTAVTQPTTETTTAKPLVLATPSIRRFAREKGVLLAEIQGTGPHGRITREDVEGFNQAKTAETSVQPSVQAAPAPSAAIQINQDMSEPVEVVAFKGIRKVIADAMVRSKFTAPHVTIMDEADATKLVALRSRVKPLAEKKAVKLTYLPFIVKAVVGALRAFPVVNATINEEKAEIIYKKFYNIGIATDTDNGLMVPVIFNADRKGIWQIAAEIQDLAVTAREGKLNPQQMKNGTFSITNIGSAGGQFFTPVINYPEVAILGIGRISEKPVVKDGIVQVAQVLALSLSFDHRLIDGATAQHFMNYLKEILEDPDLLLMEV